MIQAIWTGKRANRLLALAAVVCLALALVLSAGVAPRTAEAEETSPVPIDMYLVGGQSNAVGYSFCNNTEMQQAFGRVKYDIMYAADVDRNVNGTPGVNNYNVFPYRDNVSLGLGRTSSQIGPEFGMAEVLSPLYTGSDRKAMIFKSAAGGTSLTDKSSGGSQTYGNWYPRSLWPAGYDPATRDPLSITTGVQYYRFVENFRDVFTSLKENGYAPEVKGMYWMQGEEDWYTNIPAYKELLTTFIRDIRTDIAAITGNENDLLMPFAIGEVAVTFGDNSGNATRERFDEMQREAAVEAGAAVTVKTDDLIIVDPVTGEKVEGCFDQYHFKGMDAYELGKRAGEALIGLSSGHFATVVPSVNGSVGYSFSDDNLVVTVVPDKLYKLGSLKVNGTDVTASVSDGKLVMPTGGENRFVIEASFVRRSVLVFTKTFDSSQGSVEIEPTYEGDTLSVVVKPANGYVVQSVKFGDTELTLAEDGTYVGPVVTAGGEVTVVFARANADRIGGKGGCKKADLATAFALIGSALAAACILLRK